MRSASHAARLGFLIVALSLAGCSGGANVNPTPQGLSQSQTQATALQNMPTSKDQCKDGSWQTFGVFKNQGDCVSYVATHGKNPPDVTPSPAPTPTTTPTPIGSFVEFAYVANSGSGNVSAYTIDATNGALTPAAGSPFGAGSGPHGVAVDPTGKFAFVTNQNDNNVSAYTIDTASGALTPLAGSPFGASSSPYGIAVTRPNVSTSASGLVRRRQMH